MNKTIVYYLPISSSKEELEKANKKYKKQFGEDFTPFLTTEEHIHLLVDKLIDGIDKVGNSGGWYVDDEIKVSIEIKYEPENK